MKVQDLVKELQKFQPGAEVVVWTKDGFITTENVTRDFNGDVGINWTEPK